MRTDTEQDVALAQRLYGLILAGRKELPVLLRAESWDPAGKDRGRLLLGASVVVSGGGAVADELMRLLAPCGADVVRVDTPDALGATLGTADVLVLLSDAHPDARPDARGGVVEDVDTGALLGVAALARLPRGAVLIDAGTAVGPDALANGLAAGHPEHAAVVDSADVLADRIPAGHPLWDSPRALLVPIAAPVTASAGAPS